MPTDPTATSIAPPAPPASVAVPTYQDYARHLAEQNGVPWEIADTVLNMESGGQHTLPDGSLKYATALPNDPDRPVGFGQLRPSTAKGYGYDATDPGQNLEALMRYLHEGAVASGGDPRATFAYYHGGPNLKQHGPLTAAYAEKAMQLMATRAQAAQQAAQQGSQGTTAAPVTGTPQGQPQPRRGGFHVPTQAENEAATRGDPGAGGETGASSPGVFRKFAGELTMLDPRPPLKALDVVQQALGHAVAHPSEPWQQLTDYTTGLYHAAGQSVAAGDPEALYAQVPGWASSIGLAIAHGLGEADPAVYQKMMDAYSRGTPEGYLQAALEAKNWLLSTGLTGTGGRRLSAAEEYARQGDVPRAAGATTDAALALLPTAQLTLGKLGLAAPTVKIPRLFKSTLPPEKQAAVDLLQTHGIPVDLGTATGGTYTKRLINWFENSPLGGLVRNRVVAERAQGLEDLAGKLGSRVQLATSDRITAGEHINARLKEVVDDAWKGTAQAYSAVDRLLRDPKYLQQVQTGTKQVATGILDAQGNPIMRTQPIFESIQFPIDMRPVKGALRQIYDDTKSLMPIGKKNLSEGYTALSNIMEGPDFVPALSAEKNLGALKGAADVEEGSLRNAGQGLAARTVAETQDAIDAAIRQTAGPSAQQALANARRFNAEKWRLEGVRKTFFGTKGEGGYSFDLATRPDDNALQRLLLLKNAAPDLMPEIGRAYLDNLVRESTRRGGWERAAAMANHWEQLGDRTKQLLFGSHAKDLDSFFLGSRMLAENQNPSGSFSGLAVASSFRRPLTAAGGLLLAKEGAIPAAIVAGLDVLGEGGFAKLLNSPEGVRLLTKGMTIRSNTLAARAWLGEATQLVARSLEQDAAPVKPGTTVTLKKPADQTAAQVAPPPAPPGSSMPPPRPGPFSVTPSGRFGP
jgi:hypothetical protein